MKRHNLPQDADKALEPGLPYPSGWFCAGFSDEIKPGAIAMQKFMGDEIIIYRTRSGVLNATRPYCPHLGAHLGAGGTVDGENIVCPFHKWGFAPDGACVHTPYGQPPKAKLDLLPVREIAEVIWVWYSPDGSSPAWEIPSHLCESGPLSHRELSLAGHPQDVMENLPDHQHFRPVHKTPAPHISIPEKDGPFYSSSLRIQRSLPPFGVITQDGTVRLFGLGGLRFEYLLFGNRLRAYTWILPTPVAPWSMKLRIASSVHVRVSERGTPLAETAVRCMQSVIRLALTAYTVRDVRRDVPIWRHKKYMAHPKLNNGDGPIGSFRIWARQFYPPDKIVPTVPEDGAHRSSP
ncbi:Rieske 2Fe-2S domain-containing protein [Streptomyces sp. NPDC048384]|uniref:Rieske 2Fe-2S domain-containing protein n=1 Tax=Streptomyces sp. NPDC048384 TaxID=3155487 RepID=UPI003439016B